MLPIDAFEARRVREPTADEAPLVKLSFRGREVGGTIPGAALERQFQLADGRFVLFLTDDTPYEETLRIYLLSEDFRILDGLVLGSAYVTGRLENLAVDNDETIEFSFVHKDRCRLRVDRTPRWRLPSWPGPGVKRLGSWPRRRFLELTFLKA